MWNLTYNIHNLLTIDINGRGPSGIGADLKYSFFKTESEGNADIILNIGKFNPSNSGCNILSHKYYVKDNYFYCRDKGKRAKWELEIFGFESGKTVINFNGKKSGIAGRLFPTFLAQEFLMPFIEYKLEQKGCILLHSGAICKSSNAHAFVGRMGSFKTTLVMDCIRRADYSYLGDDRIILAKNRIFCFPISFFLFDFMLRNTLTEKRNFRDDFNLLWQLIANKSTLKTPITVSANLSELIFLSRRNNNRIKEINVIKLPKEKGIIKLAENNKLELVSSMPEAPTNAFYKYLLYYSLVFPANKLTAYFYALNGILEENLNNAPMFEIEMPLEYTAEVFNQVNDLLSQSRN